MAEAARLCLLEHARTITFRQTEKRKGMRQILDREPGLLGETLRCQIIGVAPRGRIMDLDQPLLDATLEVGVDKAKRYSKFRGDPALRTHAIRLDGTQQ